MKKSVILLITVISFLSCNNDDKDYPEGGVDIYLIESYETQENSAAIVKNSVVLGESPIVSYNEIVSYNKNEHLFSLTGAATERITNLEHSVSGVPFAVTASSEIIYTAYFWPAYSSATCNWVVADPIMMDYQGGLKVELGYPGLLDGMEIPDYRNDETLIGIFERDGKLR